MEVFRKLWTTAENIVGSTKLMVGISAAIVALAAKWGLNLSTEAVVAIVAPIIAAILGRSHVEAAVAKASAPKISLTEIQPSKN